MLTCGDGTFDEAASGRAFASEGLSPTRWSAPAGDAFAPHRHARDKVLFCVSGSIVFTIEASGARIAMAPGDRLDLPAGVAHSAVAGERGVTCIEAMRR